MNHQFINRLQKISVTIILSLITLLPFFYLAGNQPVQAREVQPRSPQPLVSTQPITNFLVEACVITQVTQSQEDLLEAPGINANENSWVVASATIDPEGDNPDRNPEIYVLKFAYDDNDRLTYTPYQVSRTAGNMLGGFNFSPDIDIDAKRIVFASDAYALSDGNEIENTGGNFEIVLAEITEEIDSNEKGSLLITYTWVTTSDGFNESPTISANGNFIAFVSDANLTGNNSDGNSEIFWADLRDLDNIRFIQVTNTAQGNQVGTNQSPTISPDGQYIVFTSNHNGIVTGQGGNNPQIFRASINQTTNTATLIQITNNDAIEINTPFPNTSPSGLAFADPVVTDRGHQIIFSAHAPAGQQLLVYNSFSNKITPLNQQPPLPNSNYQPSINADGRFIAFVSSRPLTSTVGNQQEIFVLMNISSQSVLVRATDNLTTTPSLSEHPSVSYDGNRIVFITNQNLVDLNEPRNREIFLLDCEIADLAIRKATPHITFTAGTPITYTIHLTNHGPSPARNVEVVDVLQSGLEFMSGSAECSDTNNQFSCELGDLGKDETRTITLTAQIPSGGVKIITNVVKADSNTYDLDEQNNTHTITNTVGKVARLSVSKTATPNPVVAGTPLTYHITIDNLGPSDVQTVTLTDTIPSEVTAITPLPTNCSSVNNEVICTLGPIKSGQQATQQLPVLVSPTAEGDIINTVVISGSEFDPNLSDNRTTQVTSIGQSVDLALTKTAFPNPAIAGDLLTYTLTIYNYGPSNASGAILTDTLPSGVGVVELPNRCTEVITNTVRCEWNEVIPLESAVTAEIVVAVDPKTQFYITNFATVTSTYIIDPHSDNNLAQINTEVATPADLAITKSAITNTAVAGEWFTYTLTLVNRGPANARNVLLTDTLPSGVTPRSIAPTACTYQNGLALCNWHLLNAGTTEYITLTVEVDSMSRGSLTNSVIVTSTQDDLNLNNNADILITPIEAKSDLTLHKRSVLTQATPGNPLTYTLTITNNGPSAATSVVLTDVLPINITGTSVSAGCQLITSTVNCGWATIDPDEVITATVVITLHPAQTEGVTNTAEVSSIETDLNPNDNISTILTPVAAEADLAIAKMGYPSPPIAGESMTYTIIITNQGPSYARQLVLTDTLSPSLTVTSLITSAGSCQQQANLITCTLAILPVNEILTVTIGVDLPPDVADSELINQAGIHSDIPDSNLTNNHTTHRTTPIGKSDLSIHKTASANPATIGSPLTYTLYLTNTGPSVATAITITDELPSEVVYSTGTPNCAASGGIVTCTVASLPVGGSLPLTLQVHVPATLSHGLVVTNQVSVQSGVTDPISETNSDTITTTLQREADLGLQKDGPIQTIAGLPFTYTLTITNNGPSAVTGVVMTDVLNSALIYLSSSEGCGEQNKVVTCTIATLTSGSQHVFTISVDVPATLEAGAIITNTAIITGLETDPNPINNQKTISTTIYRGGDLNVKKAGPTSATAGEIINYTITLTNQGPSEITNVVLTDTFPIGLSYLGQQPTINGCTFTTNTLSCPLGNLAVDENYTLLLTTTIATSIPHQTSLTNHVEAWATETDPDATNNQAGADTTIERESDLEVNKIAPGTGISGEDLVYTIIITNHGPSDASVLTITDTLPISVTYISDTGNCTNTANLLSCSLDSLTANTPYQFEVTVNIAEAIGGNIPITNSVVATSQDPDPNLINNESEATTSINQEADLMVTKLGPNLVTAGDIVTYTITVTNNGPWDALKVVLSDTLPSGLTFLNSSLTPASITSSNPITWNMGTMTKDQTISITVTAGVASWLENQSIISNVAEVSSANYDSIITNNLTIASTIITREVDVVITKTMPAQVIAGTIIPITFTIYNAGPSDAAEVLVVDDLPDDLTYSDVISDPNLIGCEVANGGGVFSCTLRSVGAGSSGEVAVLVKTASSIGHNKDRINTAQVTTSELDNYIYSNMDSTTFYREADIQIQKIAPQVITAGTRLTYTIVLTNAGPSDVDLLRVRDAILWANIVEDDSSPECSQNQGVVRCDIQFFEAGTNYTLTIAVNVPVNPTEKMIVNTAQATILGPENDPTPENKSSITTTINLVTDLGITKTGPNIATAGLTMTYKITVTNYGPSDASNVIITDVLHNDLVYQFASNECTNNQQVVICVINTLSVSSSRIISLTAMVLSRTDDDLILENTAKVKSAENDPNINNNNSTFYTTIEREADMEIKKLAPDIGHAGEALSYTLLITNNGPSDANSVVLFDDLDIDNVIYQAVEPENDCNSSIVCFWDAIPAGYTKTVQIDVEVKVISDKTVVDNTADVSSEENDPHPLNDVHTISTLIVRDADLAITKTGLDEVEVDELLTYTIVVTNNGPWDIPSDVIITDTLPVGFTYISASVGCTSDNNQISCNLGSLNQNDSEVITITTYISTTLADKQRVTNTAQVWSTQTDLNQINNTSLVTTTIRKEIDLAISKTGPITAVAGLPLTYAITITNNGPWEASGVVISDILPSALTYLDATQGCGNANGVVTCTIGTLAVSSIRSVTITAYVPSNLTDEEEITNVAHVFGAETDPDNINNTDDFKTTINREVTLVVSKHAPIEGIAGENIDYTILVTNIGPSEATTVTLVDTLPDKTTYISGSNGCIHQKGIVTCILSTLPPGNVWTTTLTTKIRAGFPDGETITNEAEVTATETMPISITASVSSDVKRLTDLEINKTGTLTITAGNEQIYKLTVINHGPSRAENLIITDVLPENMTYSAISNNCTHEDGTITCTINQLAATDDREFNITVETGSNIADEEEIPNTATVFGDEEDPNTLNNSSTFTTTFEREADLDLSKNAPAIAFTGETFTYTIALENKGPSDATDVQLSDTLPPSLTYLDASPMCNPPLNGKINCIITNVVALTTTVITIQVQVPLNFNGHGKLVTNTVKTLPDVIPEPDPNDNNNTASVGTTIYRTTDLAVTKTGPITGIAGTPLTYIIQVANNGNLPASNVTITDTLPAGINYISDTRDCTPIDKLVICNIDVIPSSTTEIIYLTASILPTVTQSSILTNTVEVAATEVETNPDDNVDTFTTTVDREVDLAVHKIASAPAVAGQPLTYTILITNYGPSMASGIQLIDTLPSEVIYHSSTPGCTGDETITCSLPDLNINTSMAVTIVVNLPPNLDDGLIITNVITATSNEPDLVTSNNYTSITTSVERLADLIITKTAPNIGYAGEYLTYTVIVTNSGPSLATNIILTDTLPSFSTYHSSQPVCANGGSTITCSVGSLLPQTSYTLVLTTNVASTISAGEQITNTIVVSGTETDPISNNNQATITTTINHRTDLQIHKIGPPQATAGEVLTYTIIITNAGPVTANNLLVTDTFSDALTFIGSDAGCGLTTGNVVTCSIGSLASNGVYTITLLADIDPGAAHGEVILNKASVWAEEGDPIPVNNISPPVNTTVQRVADLVIDKMAPSTATPNSQISYTLVVTNLGPSDISGVRIEDTLPISVSHNSSTPLSSCRYYNNNKTVTCDDLTILNGESFLAIITVTVKNSAKTGDLIINQANTSIPSSANGTDPNSINNQDTVTTTVSATAKANIPIIDTLSLTNNDSTIKHNKLRSYVKFAQKRSGNHFVTNWIFKP